MPFLKYKCTECGHVFDELVRAGEDAPRCPDCGGKTQRAYEGKCLSAHTGCAGDCSCCGGCHHD